MMILDSKFITVLVVDDDEINRTMASMILKKKLPYKVLTAESGMRAIEIMAANKVNLVLLDIDMPIWDGFKTLEIMRSEKKMQDIPVIMLTAAADLATVVKANDYGIREYIRKPFMPEDLVERVAKVIWEKWQNQDTEKKPSKTQNVFRNIPTFEEEDYNSGSTFYSDLF